MSLLIGSALQAIISVVSMGFKEVSYPLTPMSRLKTILFSLLSIIDLIMF